MNGHFSCLRIASFQPDRIKFAFEHTHTHTRVWLRNDGAEIFNLQIQQMCRATSQPQQAEDDEFTQVWSEILTCVRVVRLSVAFGFPFVFHCDCVCVWMRPCPAYGAWNEMCSTRKWHERCPVARVRLCARGWRGLGRGKVVMLRRISICEPHSNVKIIRFGGIVIQWKCIALFIWCMHRGVNSQDPHRISLKHTSK